MPSLILLKDSEGNVVDTQDSNTYDGIFYANQDGKLKYKSVSAVVFYQYLRGGEHHISTLRIYHNPYAAYPLERSIFVDYDQFIYVGDGLNDGRMEWLTANSTD